MTLAAQFDTDDSFYALRLEPYLVACAARYPELAEQLYGIVKRTAACKLALVHGDVSPKNILVGPKGPVLLDAECAWFGDPSFDLAFCLNHLLLKGLKRQGQTVGLRTSFHALAEAYFDQVDWEPRQALEARAASLLPALLLARVDGKSPVEYLTSEDQRKIVRDHAIPLLSKPVHQLLPIADTWYDRIVRCG